MKRPGLLVALTVVAAACTTCGGADSTATTTAPAVNAPATTVAPPSPTTTGDLMDVVLFDVSELVKSVRPGVVTVTQTQITVGLFGGSSEQEAGTGTGNVFDDEGHVLTNFHVIAGAERVFVIAEDGAPRPARVIGGFAGSDLAVLEIGSTHEIVFVRGGQLFSTTITVAER